MTSGGANFAIEHEQVYVQTQIIQKAGTKNLCTFLTGGAYAPYATCMSTSLHTTHCWHDAVTGTMWPIMHCAYWVF